MQARLVNYAASIVRLVRPEESRTGALADSRVERVSRHLTKTTVFHRVTLVDYATR